MLSIGRFQFPVPGIMKYIYQRVGVNDGILGRVRFKILFPGIIYLAKHLYFFFHYQFSCIFLFFLGLSCRSVKFSGSSDHYLRAEPHLSFSVLAAKLFEFMDRLVTRYFLLA